MMVPERPCSAGSTAMTGRFPSRAGFAVGRIAWVGAARRGAKNAATATAAYRDLFDRQALPALGNRIWLT